MSTISNVGNSYLNATSSAILPPARQNASQVDNEGGGRPHRGGGGHRIGGAIGEALQQIGLNLPPPPPAASAAGGSAPAGATQAPGASDAGRAFHEFAHTLFQALRSQSPGQDLSEGSGQPGQSRLGQSVQSLLQQITGGTESGNSTVSDLTDAFANLVKALGGGSASDGTAPTLQAFLEKFQQDLQSGKVSTSGLAVNTAA